MLVTDSGAGAIPNGYPMWMQNGSFETWSNGRPAGYAMYSDTYFNYMTRDSAIRHSGTSAARFDLSVAHPLAWTCGNGCTWDEIAWRIFGCGTGWPDSRDRCGYG